MLSKIKQRREYIVSQKTESEERLMAGNEGNEPLR